MGYATISGADVVTGWTEPTELLPNVWTKSIAHNATGANRGTVYDKDGLLLTRVETEAECSSTPGTFVDIRGSTANPWTVQVNPREADSSPEGYSVTTRFNAVFLGDNARVFGVRAGRAISNNGAIEVGENSLVDRCLAFDGTKHNMLLASGKIRRTVAFRADRQTSYAPSSTPFVIYTTDAAGKHAAMEYCFAIDDLGTADGTMLIMHDSSGNIYESFTARGCGAYGFPYGIAPGAIYVDVAGYYVEELTGAFNVYSDDAVFDYLQIRAGYGDTGLRFESGTGDPAIWRVRHSVFYDEGSNSGLFRLRPEMDGHTLELTNNLIYSSAFRNTMTNAGMSSGTIRINRNIFCYTSNGSPINIPSGVSYEGDHNIFVCNTNGGTNLNLNYNGVSYDTLAAWQSATGQDANSIAAGPSDLASLFSGNVALGDFRLGASGLGASAAALTAGPQYSWDWNAAKVKAGTPTVWPILMKTAAQVYAYQNAPHRWTF